ncbi:MAG: AbrB/MazE/SpoVT family DNA-binding domain-containing protein [Candidatus Bathyarchaeota archaeon]|nr:MAG: AbrB/MazE/SpoVT family DNA-binding domain-containing protein [Candidatus Bathyarchaeota archaeon]
MYCVTVSCILSFFPSFIPIILYLLFLQNKTGTTSCRTKSSKVSKITSNRQVTIPKEIMKRLKLKTGDKIVWIQQNNNITIKKGKIISEE